LRGGLKNVGNDWCVEFDLDLLVASCRLGNRPKLAAPIEAALATPDAFIYDFLVDSPVACRFTGLPMVSATFHSVFGTPHMEGSPEA